MLRKMSVFLALALSLFISVALYAQSNGSAFVRDAVGEKQYPAAPRLALQVNITPAVTLDSVKTVMPEKVVALRERNAAGNVPMQNGIGRDLVDPVRVQLTGGPIAAAKDGPIPLGRGVVAMTSRGVAWAANVKVNGAERLRLHLADVHLPDEAVLWVYGSNDSTAFGKELVDPTGGLWTLSTFGDTVHLELEVPSGAPASFSIDRVVEIIDSVTTPASLKPGTNDVPSCLLDINCVTSTPFALSTVSKAIAHLEFIDGGSGYVCTGGLINDKPSSSGNPAYLITANHCINNQSAASSLQAYFDWKWSSCSSTTIPPLSSVPKSSGSTLLATVDKTNGSDVTLLRMNSIPGGRILLGWTTDQSQLTVGASIYRISHPAPTGYGPQPQMYSSTTVSGSGTARCSTLPTSRFLYSTNQAGGTYGGSSGSPVCLSNGQIVGQLYGGCGVNPENGCDPTVQNVDGAFASDYPVVKPYIDSGNVTPQQCTPSSTVACLSGGRFSVHVDWKTSDGKTGQGQAIKYTDASALFWFFGSDNIEMLMKILNACPIGSTYWVFSAATTDVEYTLYVTDTKTGVTKSYFHAGGTPAPAITDTAAFDKNLSCP